MSITQANGLRHFYRRDGNRQAPTLVLAHPIGFAHTLWDAVAPALSQHFQVIRYDLRGHGATEGTHEPYSVRLLAEDATALLQSLGIERFGFVGTSLGGLVGLQLALDLRDRMTALVVANASARLPVPAEEWNRRIALANASGPPAFVAGMTERMFSAGFREGDDPRVQSLIKSFVSMDGHAYAAAMAALRDADLRPQLAQVRVSTMVVAGEADAVVPRDHSVAMASGIAGATLTILPGGHLSAVESPDAFARAVVSFCSH
jgi:3-oxoadipate enol-lactonase